MKINGFLYFLTILLFSTIGVYSSENSKLISESQPNKFNSIEDFEIDKDERSLLSLSNIQNDIWSDRFLNGFSCIELEDERSGIIHLLNNSSNIKLGSDEYTITSINMPNYDSLIVFFEDINISFGLNEEYSEVKKQNLLVVTNETENEILIKSNKLSNGFVCMGILNGTEIWSKEFCEIMQDYQINETACICKGSFVYSLVESRDQNRALQMQYNKFDFPDLSNSANTKTHHVNDAYLNRVSRNDNPNLNHGDKVPFPPLHGNIGGRSSNVNMQKKEATKTPTKNVINFEQNELMQYYHSGLNNKYVINNQDIGHTYDNLRLNELNHKNSINKETNQVNSKLVESKDLQKGTWKTTENDTFKTNNSINNNKLHTDLLTSKVDSITVNMELKNVSFESLNNHIYKQNLLSKLINTLSSALSIVPNKLKIVNIWNEENPSLRGSNSGSIGITVSIITNIPDEIITKVKNLKSQISEFSKIYEFYIISISKNIGSKSISNEIITYKPDKEKTNKVNTGRDSLRALPIIFTMDLRTKKPNINQKEAFALLEDELSRSMKIPKSSIDIPEFTYKQLNDPFTNEVYLSIHTEIWVHPEKQVREEYSILLTKIYSNIIHNKKSSFSSIFLCNKHEIKEIPRIKAHLANENEATNQNEKKEFSRLKINENKELESVDEGRISKIGGFYQINQNSNNNHKDIHTKKSELVEKADQNLYNENSDENIQIKPVVYLFKE